MPHVKDRKELFALLSSICESNRTFFTRYGKWDKPSMKIFWIEINKAYLDEILRASGIEKIDQNLFELNYKDDLFWFDTSDDRIWQIFTLATTEKTHTMISEKFMNCRGADRIWLTEKFMVGIQDKLGYSNRGFGIKYKDVLAIGDEPGDFSAKLWTSKNSTQNQLTFLRNAKETFSISTIRFGRSQSQDGKPLSGELYELYFNGHLTVTTSDNIENVIHVINTIRESYKEHLLYLEKQNAIKPMHVDYQFSDEINLEGFDVITNFGTSKMRLWLQKYQEENDLIRFNGVDLHTGDLVNIDIAKKYSYVSASKNACMNVAPRFGTLSARYISSSVSIIHDGVELFAR